MAETGIVHYFNKVADLIRPLLTKVVTAVLILLIGFIIGRVLGKLVQRFLHEIELNGILKKAAGIRISVEEIFGLFVTYFVYFIAVVMALNQIGLTTTVLNMISGGVIVILIISIVLGIKDFVPNILAGLFIHQKRFVKVGDTIKVKDVEGKIVYINLLETRVKNKEGDIIYFPNSMLTKSEVIKKKK